MIKNPFSEKERIFDYRYQIYFTAHYAVGKVHFTAHFVFYFTAYYAVKLTLPHTMR